MGNCGVGFAPVRPERRDWLIGLMEGVEDIPGTALAEGIEWEWETFPEYLDALEPTPVDHRRRHPDRPRRRARLRHGRARRPQRAGHARGHRRDAGDRARRRSPPARSGFSTSRTIAHVAIDGEPVPGTFAAEDELFGIGAALGELGTGVFELAPPGAAGEDIVGPAKEVDWMRRLSADDRPSRHLRPPPGRHGARPVARADGRVARRGRRGRRPLAPGRRRAPPACCRGSRPPTASSTRSPPTRSCGPGLSDEELVAALRDPEVRAAILGWEPDEATPHRLAGAYGRTYLLGDPPDYEPGPERSLAGIAAANGVDPRRGRLRRDAGRRRTRPALRADPQLRGRQPRPGPRDAPAPPGRRGPRRRWRPLRRHLRRLDAHVHAHALDPRPHPGRDAAARVGREEADPRHRPALRARRPRHARGRACSATSTSSTTTGCSSATRTSLTDLPAGGTRLLQDATGYVATIKSGEVTFADGNDTGARPGVLLRGAR